MFTYQANTAISRCFKWNYIQIMNLNRSSFMNYSRFKCYQRICMPKTNCITTITNFITINYKYSNIQCLTKVSEHVIVDHLFVYLKNQFC